MKRVIITSCNVNKLIFNARNKPSLSIHLSKYASCPTMSRRFLSTNNTEESSESTETTHAEIETPDKDSILEALQKENKDLKDKVLRSYAEEENVRRIARVDVEKAKLYANTSFAKALLDVADDLELAIDAVPKNISDSESPVLKSLIQGVEMTDKQLQKVFKQFGVVKYGAVGDKFDPDFHDALFQISDATKEPGTIAQVLKNGYTLKDRVIRAAQVGTVSSEN